MDKGENQSLCTLSDEAVAAMAQGGNTQALDHLIARYRNYVYSKANTYFLVGAEKEDLVQEGLIGLYKAVKEYDPACGSSFLHFANLCVLRQILTAIKTATRKKHSPLNSYISLDKAGEDTAEEFLPSIGDGEQNPEDIIIGKEDLNNIECKISKVLSKYELQVFMYYTEGMSYDEIAVMLDKERKSVDNALCRIKKKLLYELSRE